MLSELQYWRDPYSTNVSRVPSPLGLLLKVDVDRTIFEPPGGRIYVPGGQIFNSFTPQNGLSELVGVCGAKVLPPIAVLELEGWVLVIVVDRENAFAYHIFEIINLFDHYGADRAMGCRSAFDIH